MRKSGSAAAPLKALYALALARISLGLIFLWAFFDKLWGLGFATCRDPHGNDFGLWQSDPSAGQG